MAINKNHEVEELCGVRCAIVEKGVPKQRAGFLAYLLKANNYSVVVEPTPPLKATPVKPGAEISAPPVAQPETFTVGVTDVTFNPVNAIFGRLLKTKDRRVVTLAYWQQKEATPSDDVPYFDHQAFHPDSVN